MRAGNSDVTVLADLWRSSDMGFMKLSDTCRAAQ